MFTAEPRSPFFASNGSKSVLLTEVAEQAFQGREPIQPADLLGDAVSAQQVTNASTCRDDAQLDVVLCKLVMQLVQHPRACHINMRRCREVADDETDVGCAASVELLYYRLKDKLGIDVEQRSFRPKSNDPG
jgi:hypothetical protein